MSVLIKSHCWGLHLHTALYTLRFSTTFQLTHLGTSIHSSWYIQVLYPLIHTYSYSCIHFSSHTLVFQYIPNCTLRFSSTFQFAHSGSPVHCSSHTQVLQNISLCMIRFFSTFWLTYLCCTQKTYSGSPILSSLQLPDFYNFLQFYNLFQITCSGFSVHTRVLRFFNTFKLLSLFVWPFLFLLWGMCV